MVIICLLAKSLESELLPYYLNMKVLAEDFLAKKSRAYTPLSYYVQRVKIIIFSLNFLNLGWFLISFVS